MLYFDYLRSRRAAPLCRVFEHNRADVLSLVALVGWFGRALADTSGVRPEELAGLGRLWEPCDLERALGCYRAALEAGVPEPVARWARLRLAWWEKRAARWDAACELWEAARSVAWGSSWRQWPCSASSSSTSSGRRSSPVA